MQVTLNFDSATVGTEIASIMGSLTDEQKNSVALQVLQEFLKQPHDVELKAAEAKAIQLIKDNLDSYDRRDGRYDTDEKIRNHSKYTDWVRNFQDTRSVMIKEITEAAKARQKEAITALINNDTQIKEIIDAEVAKFVEAFPVMVQNALTGMFTSYLSSISHNLMSSMGNQAVIANNLEDINRRMLNVHQR